MTSDDEGYTPAEIKKAVAEMMLTGSVKMPDIHDRAGWRRWAKEQSAEAQARALIAARKRFADNW